MITDQDLSVLKQAAQALADKNKNLPTSEAIVTALLQAEKKRSQYPLQQLLGNWRLGFITGTKKSRQRAGVVLGAGRFLPNWLKINLSYTADALNSEQPQENAGTILNQIQLGGLQLIVEGPSRFWAKNNIVSFDFTRMTVLLWGRQIYQGYIRNGQQKEANFYQQPLKEQAFFSYFLIQDQLIAARGRGGGLALWTKAANAASATH
jgi:hypothetical protein